MLAVPHIVQTWHEGARAHLRSSEYGNQLPVTTQHARLHRSSWTVGCRAVTMTVKKYISYTRYTRS